MPEIEETGNKSEPEVVVPETDIDTQLRFWYDGDLDAITGDDA